MIVIILGLIIALIIVLRKNSKNYNNSLQYKKEKESIISELSDLQSKYSQLEKDYESLTIKYNAAIVDYKGIIDIEERIKILSQKEDELKNSLSDSIKELLKQEKELNETINTLQKNKTELEKTILHYEDFTKLNDFGIYEFTYNFDNSESYKNKLAQIKEYQKELLKNNKAAICSTVWKIGGSLKEGEKQTKDYLKILLRAFNGECDALISDVRFNNVMNYIEKIKKSYEILNKIMERTFCSLTQEYLDAKIEEVKLVYEYQEKKQEEKEEQKRIKEIMREEEKARKELEKAQKDAEDEEKRYEKALLDAKAQLETAHGKDLELLQEKMLKLQQQLEEAHQRKEKAISQAQLTRSGHVYIISNIGSFGNDVYKIGMTRRLEPMDRIDELGDASVPFEFDVHAMIYSEDAPSLENKLHNLFDLNRVNLVNKKKEFFFANLEAIEKIVKQEGYQIEFTKLATAKEFYETQQLRKEINIHNN